MRSRKMTVKIRAYQSLIFMATILLVTSLTISAERLQLRPNLYFGARERKAEAAMFGLSWFLEKGHQGLRHECKEDDGLKRWGFVKATPSFGKQVIMDSTVQISTEHMFEDGGETLVMRINGSSLSSSSTRSPESLSVLFSFQSPAKVKIQGDPQFEATKGLRGNMNELVAVDGSSSLLVDWGEITNAHGEDICTELTERVRPGKSSPELTKTHFSSWSGSTSMMDTIKRLLGESEVRGKRLVREVLHNQNGNPENLQVAPVLPNKFHPNSTTITIQRILRVPFSVVARFSVTKARVSTGETVDHDSIGQGLADGEKMFDETFYARFNISANRGFSKEQIEMAQYAVSNTLASIGYFYGSNLLDNGTWTKPGELLSGVPSRSFFPRGFFWDEGFHQLLISKYDIATAKEVVSSWLNRFDENGWVAREQVLGQEAIDRVPQQFLAQNVTYANPPTLLMAVDSIMNHDQVDSEFLEKVYQTFKRHRSWLAKTQVSRAAEGLMAWKGRSLDGVHTLTSGIDDYPRGVANDFYMEAHVDLLSWSAWEDRVLAVLALKLGNVKDADNLSNDSRVKVELLLKHHWNPQVNFFNDIGFLDPSPGTLPEHVPHVGYVGLIPFALCLVPAEDTSKLWDVLRALQSPAILRAPGIGIRSLSRSDFLFGQGEDYWRGAAWININYLTIEALKYYSARTKDQSLSKLMWTLAKEVRKDVISNIFKQFSTTGYLFESYDSLTGKGRGTRPFTGWTALVVLLMSDSSFDG